MTCCLEHPNYLQSFIFLVDCPLWEIVTLNYFLSLRLWILSWNKSILLLLLSLATVTSCCYLDSLCLFQFLAPSISWQLDSLKSWLSNDVEDLGVWVLWLFFLKKIFSQIWIAWHLLQTRNYNHEKNSNIFHVTFSFLWEMLRHFIAPLSYKILNQPSSLQLMQIHYESKAT